MIYFGMNGNLLSIIKIYANVDYVQCHVKISGKYSKTRLFVL